MVLVSLNTKNTSGFDWIWSYIQVFFEIFLGAVDFLYYENEGLFIFILFSLLGS